MPHKPSPAEWKSLTADASSTFGDWLAAHDDVLTPKGKKFAERALQKGNLAGGTGTRVLFEPVLLVATATGTPDVDALLDICDRIPFTGDYFQWDYVRATYALAHRNLVRSGDETKAAAAREMLSYPENGEQRADPFASGLPAVRDRADGAILGRSPDYPRPVTTTPALQHLVGAVREWNIMWAYGTSQEWPRPRLDDALAQAIADAGTFVRTG